MALRPDAHLARAYLEHLCRVIDSRQPLRRTAPEWWAALVLAASSCGGEAEAGKQVSPPAEQCANGTDDDRDGLADCADPECDCGTPVYAAPLDAAVSDVAPMDAPPDSTVQPDVIVAKEICHDGKDDDLDGLWDCADPECFEACGCKIAEDCTNTYDDDCDGKADCDDPNCGYDECCGVPVYAAPAPSPMSGGESCTNGRDDDCDNTTDCGDWDCVADPCCDGSPPTSEDCSNAQDDDCDGQTDCLDSDCVGASCSCSSPLDCPIPANECEAPACVNGKCTVAAMPDNAQLIDLQRGDCRSRICSAGEVIDVPNDGDAPAYEPCEQVQCFDGSIQRSKLPAGTACGKGLACDGDGRCAGCAAPSQCPEGNPCRSPVCDAGICRFVTLPDGYELNDQPQGHCRDTVCRQGLLGEQESAWVNPDSSSCTWDLCAHGVEMHPSKPAGSSCMHGSSQGTCDAQGMCK